MPTRSNGSSEPSAKSCGATLETSEAGHDTFGGAVRKRNLVSDACAVEIYLQCGANDKRNKPAVSAASDDVSIDNERRTTKKIGKTYRKAKLA
jgi:hypothetical protein